MHASKSKSKLSGQIVMMQNKLMSKLQSIDSTIEPQLQFDFLHRKETNDSLSNLLSKAKTLTINNQHEIQAARKESKQKPKRVSKKVDAFLTGVGIVDEYQLKDLKVPDISPDDALVNELAEEIDDPSPTKMLKEILKKNEDDDLEELRRMIKQTDLALNDYGKSLMKTRKEVLQVADHFNHEDYLAKIRNHKTVFSQIPTKSSIKSNKKLSLK